MKYEMRRSSKPPEGVAAIGLDEFLNSRSIERLERLLDKWAPEDEHRHSKLALIRQLRNAMLDRDRVRKVLDRFDQKVLNTLHAIIRTGTERSSSYDEIKKLDDTGLVYLLKPIHNRFGSTPVAAIVPGELKQILVDILEIDLRTLSEVITLDAYLATFPPDRYEQAVKPFLEESKRDGTRETDIRLLLEFECVRMRVGRLPQYLQNCIIQSVSSRGGILRVSKELKRKVPDFRKLVASNLIGTVREIPLEFLDSSGDGIIVFTDITRAFHTLPADEPAYCDIINREIDTLADLTAIIEHLHFEPAKVRQSGGVYKSSLRSLAAVTGLSDDEAEYGVQEYMQILDDAGLLQVQRNEVTPVADEVEEWFNMDPTEQITQILHPEEVLHAPVSPHFVEAFAKALREYLPDELFDVEACVSHMIIDLLRMVAKNEAVTYKLYGISNHSDLLELCRSWLDTYIRHGALVLYKCEDGSSVMRLSELGVLYFNPDTPLAGEDVKTLFVNPDFEAIIFRHGSNWRQALVMARFAKRLKTDQAYHFKIDRQHVEAAVLTGFKADEILAFLKEHSRTPIPQNVEYSIKEWAAGVSRAKHYQSYIIEVDEPAALDVIMQDEQLQKSGIRRIAPTAAVIKDRISRKATLTRLRQYGIFVHNF